jgi:hypothetical protein
MRQSAGHRAARLLVLVQAHEGGTVVLAAEITKLATDASDRRRDGRARRAQLEQSHVRMHPPRVHNNVERDMKTGRILQAGISVIGVPMSAFRLALRPRQPCVIHTG